jgi:hypothetical protein
LGSIGNTYTVNQRVSAKEERVADLADEVRKFFRDQGVFLTNPARSIANLRPELTKKWSQPIVYVIASSAFSIALGKVNVNSFGERVQRITPLPEVVSGQAGAVLSVLFLAVAVFVAFWLIGGRASFLETLAALMYATAFVLPVLTIVLVVATRIGSALLGETIIVIPASRILGLGGPEIGWLGLAVAAMLTTVTLYWNAYFSWLLWSVLRELHGVGGLWAAGALCLSAGGVYAISDWIGVSIGPLISISLPLWELLK